MGNPSDSPGRGTCLRFFPGLPPAVLERLRAGEELVAERRRPSMLPAAPSSSLSRLTLPLVPTRAGLPALDIATLRTSARNADGW
jgi:hypothetical protein